jgi:hypothetical protein
MYLFGKYKDYCRPVANKYFYSGFIKAVISLNPHRLIASEMGLGSKVKVKQSLFRPVHSQRVAGQ